MVDNIITCSGNVGINRKCSVRGFRFFVSSSDVVIKLVKLSLVSKRTN